jgi:putative flippase GtrA
MANLSRAPSALLLQMLAYGCVGVFSTVVTVSIMFTVAQMGFGYVAYTLVGYVAGFVVSYQANNYFTFRANPISARVFARFLMINSGLLVCIQALQYSLIDTLRFRELYAVPVCMVIYTIAGFLLNRRLVFIRVGHTS